MDARALYGARKVTHVSTLAEVNETIENAKNLVNMVDVIIESCHGSRVINNMVDVITENFSALLHELYFDNFFTSYSLMSDLAKIDLRATGAIRENRTAGANQKMISSKQLQKQERGCFEYCCDRTVYTAK